MPRSKPGRIVYALLCGALAATGLSGRVGAPACAQTGCSAPNFSPTTNYAAGAASQSLAVGDFNGDSNPDIATANRESHNVSVLLGNGAGGFAAATNFAAGISPNTVVVADFNEDGKSDLAASNGNSNNVSILIGAGDGSFSGPTNFAAGSSPHSMVVSDFNGDGKKDLATSHIGSNQISVLPGTGTGSFGSPIVTPAAAAGFSSVVALAVGDFNGDGKSDLAGVREKTPQTPIGPGSLTIFLGTGAGGFTPGYTNTVRVDPIFVAVGNFNADAFSDLAVANRTSGSVSVLLGDGNGNFSAPQTVPVGGRAEAVTVADFNLDGKNDLAVARQDDLGRSDVAILLGNGAGAFTASGNFAVGSIPWGIVTADFNKDGKSDLATANVGSGNISVLVNGCGGGAAQASFQIEQSTYIVNEERIFVGINVIRTGTTNTPVTVDYSTSNGTASERSDYTTALGTLRFAEGETLRGFTLLVSEDSLVEGPESFTVSLSNPTGGASLGALATATIQITDDLNEPAHNAIDDANLFVGQHYHDFLNRRADMNGLIFWENEIRSCGINAACLDFKRASVSQAFFLSTEFQKTGYQVFRVYKASFTDSAQRPKGLPRFHEFLRNTQELQRGVLVGQGDWEQQLAVYLNEYVRRWVSGAEFVAQFPDGMTAQEFVDKLFANSQATPTTSERDAAVAAFGVGNAEGRAAALLSVTDSRSVYDRQYNPAFVLMQYFGYLRRNPSDAPEPTLDFAGYDFWLTKLNQFSLPGEDVRDESVARGRALRAEMVRSFLVSGEYRQRFGP